MRRFVAISASLLLLGSLFLGCTTRQQDDKKNVQVDPPKPKVDGGNQGKPNGKNGGDPKPVTAPDDKQEKYEAALNDALMLLADRKFGEALAAFEVAQTFDDTDFVKTQIAQLKARIDQDTGAKTTIKNIETVLNDGKPDDAVKLVNEALREFGDGDDADELVKLRLQADALQNVDKNEGAEVRSKRFQDEGENALKENNLRAAALAFELALQGRDDAALKTKYEGVRGKVDNYDALRKKAAEMRRDPTQLEDALDALQAAAKEWDTPQIRAEIDELKLAQTKRRDTLSVVNFEVRNDVGMPNAGAMYADELLPRLKAKFDLVERDQLNRVLFELKAPQNFVDDPKQQAQVGKLAKVRYLVVGSVSRLVAVTVRARLVDVRSGLVVQTAKVTAPTIQEALDLAPELAKQLMMSDAEKMQLDLAEQNMKPAEIVPENAVVPAAPLVPAADDPAPRPPVLNVVPVMGDVKQDAFKNLAPPPANFVAPEAAPLPVPQANRLLIASLEIGDFLFRARRFGEAQRQFEFALQLAPDNLDVQLRLERLRPYVPPPIVYVPRPRIVFLPFTMYTNPAIVPPSLSVWTPSALTSYFSWRYEIADPAEVHWYMGRMGITIRDLIVDPNARRWLGRATGVRYFVLGTILPANSFDVNTYLIDAEFGYLQGSASIRVHNPFELKLRLQELAEITMLSPAERAVFDQQQFDRLVFAGRVHMDARRFQEALVDFDRALELRPYNVQVRVWRNQCLDQVRFRGILVELQDRQVRFKLDYAAARQRQHNLAHEAEVARRRALAEAAARSDADRRVHIDIRVRAQSNLFSQAQIALKTNRFGISVSLFRGAMDVVPPPVGDVPPPPAPQAIVYQQFAAARLGNDRALHAREAELIAVREATLRKVREQQLIDAQQALQAEQIRSQKALDTARLEQEKRDLVAFNASIKQGQGYLNQNKYEAALAAFQGAGRLAHTQKQSEQVNTYIDIIVQAQAEAAAKTDEQKKALETRLAIERQRRKDAENQAKQNGDAYKAALQLAQQALTVKNYDAAQKKFEEAGRLYRTDVVLAGLKQVEAGRAALTADAQKAQAEAKKAETVKQLVTSGNAALDAKKFTDAVQAFQQAKKLAPDNLDVLAGLARSEQARDRVLADQRRKTEETDRVQNFARLLKNGQANLAAKQFEAAVASLSEAVKLNPTDKTALAALKLAETGRAAAFTDDKARAEAKTRAEAYQKHMTAGKLALNTKRYGDAIKSFGDAQGLMKGDKTSLDFLQEAQNAKKAAEDAVAVAAKQRADEMKKAADLQKALTIARAALAGHDLAAASKALAGAKAISATDADVLKVGRDIEQTQQRLVAEAAAQKDRQQKFDVFFTAGKAALQAKKYDDAIKALASATSLIPENKDAQALFRQAQTEKRQADEALGQTKLAYQNALGAGQKSLLNKDFEAAITSAQAALKLAPNDPSALKLLQQAQTEKSAAGKLTENFNAAMAAGDKAMTAKNYLGAVKAYTDATKLNPTDMTARMRLAQAQQALNDAQAALAQANYKQAMSSGQTAMNGKQYKAAVGHFQDALKWIPNDKAATQQLGLAQKALADSTKPAPADPKKQFDEAMQRGADADKDKKFSEAVKAYQEALKVRPKDAAAQKALNSSQFSLHMATGQQYLDNSMWVNAQSEFQSAVNLFPGNAQAQKLLQKAKNKMK